MTDKEYFDNLKSIIASDEKFADKEIIQLSIIGIVHFDPSMLKDIQLYLDQRNFFSLLNYKFESRNILDQMEFILAKDNNGQCFFAALIEPVDLWSNKYLYNLIPLNEEECIMLITSDIKSWKWV